MGKKLYSHGAYTEAIYKYLYHKGTEIVKLYLDNMPQMSREMNQDYFSSKPNELAKQSNVNGK